MVSALRSVIKINRYGRLLLTAAVCLCMVLTACDTYGNRYPFRKHCTWICENPTIEFTLVLSENGRYLDQNSYFDIDGQRIPVFVDFRASSFVVYPDNGEDSVNYNERLLLGEWKYRSGMLVFKIEEDYIFGGAYTELVFEGSGEPIQDLFD